MNKKESKKVKEITKKVYCYKITNKDNLSELLNEYKDKIGDSWKNLDKNLLYSKDGHKFFMEILEINSYSTKEDGLYDVFSIILYKLKENDLPYIFNFSKGQKSKINIANDDSILEQTHAMIIPKQNLMLMEDNYVGAKVHQLPHIIISALGPESTKDLEIKPITNHKVIEKFKNGSNIKSYTFEAGQQGMNALSSILPLGILEQTEELYERDNDLVYEVTIKNKKRGQAISKNKFLKEKIMKIFGNYENTKNQSVEDIRKFNVNLINEEFPLKMLDDFLLQKITVNKLDEKYKYLDTKNVFKNLIELYNSEDFKLDNKHKITFLNNKYESNLIGLVSDLSNLSENIVKKIEDSKKALENVNSQVAVE